MKQYRTRWLWATRTDDGWVVWLGIAGRKPLAHLPRWRRRLLHLPSVRFRLWPRPFRKSAHKPRKAYFRMEDDLRVVLFGLQRDKFYPLDFEREQATKHLAAWAAGEDPYP